ncbi:MAG TPA: hypothetical protein VGA69_01610 [Nitriliruptorales bacterium]
MTGDDDRDDRDAGRDDDRDAGQWPERETLSVDEVAELLRGAGTGAPPGVTDRAVSRVRVESTAVALLRTLGGAWLRVGRALPDLLVHRSDASELEDPGELPEPPG